MNKYKVTWDERLGEALVDEPIKLGLETAGAVITRISIEPENPFGFDKCCGGYYACLTVKGHDFTVDIDIAGVHKDYDEVEHFYDPSVFEDEAVGDPAVITDFIDEETAEQLYFDVRDQILDVAPELWAEHCKHCPDSAPYKWDQGEPEEW